MKYISVGIISNNTQAEITVRLGVCEEIRVAPGLSFELLVEDKPSLIIGEKPDAPQVYINYLSDGLQIHTFSDDPEWLIFFGGRRIKPGYSTVLEDYTL